MIFVRDSTSYELVTTRFSNVRSYKCPNMAGFIYPSFIDDLELTQTHPLYLMREDVEQAVGDTGNGAIPPDVGVGGWHNILGTRCWGMSIFRVISVIAGRLLPVGMAFSAWKAMAMNMINTDVAAFSHADVVITSRLHGHILALLLGIKVVLKDNSYGKNSAYYSEWHKEKVTGIALSD